jgi:hypothetical protein
MPTKNKQYNFLCSLPDSLLLKAIKMLFVRTKQKRNLITFLMYKFIVDKTDSNRYIRICVDNNTNEYYPAIEIESDFYGHGAILSKQFQSFTDENDMFDDYYSICFKLNRNETINNILS